MIAASNPHEAVGAFWASFLVDPVPHANGVGDIANMMAGATRPPTEDEVGAFRAAIEAASRGSPWLTIDVDGDLVIHAAEWALWKAP